MARDPKVEALLTRGLEALEQEDFETAQEILEKAQSLAGDEDAGVRHLAGMIAWQDEDLQAATQDLLAAVQKAPDDPDYRLDAAECLFALEQLEDAEAHVRAVLEGSEASAEVKDEARLLYAQLRLADDDPEEALELLDGVDDERKQHPVFLSTRSTVYVADERFDEAITDLTAALDIEPDDPDLHYQMAVALDYAGRVEPSRQAMVRVLELDEAAWDERTGGEVPPLSDVEADVLRSGLEEVMEALPDPILKLVGTVPISVQPRATPAQVLDGLNPRSVVGFLGTPKSDDAEGELKGIVIMRDLLLAEVADEEEVEGELFYALAEEIQVFFQRTDLVIAEA